MTMICPHKWVDEYYGTKCLLCEAFYPFGCAPWDDEVRDGFDFGDHLEQACELANLAAGYVVGEVGTTVCPIETLRSLLSDGPGDAPPRTCKVSN